MSKKGYSSWLEESMRFRCSVRDFIECSGYKTPGFAFVRRREKHGYPPNSPDLMLLDACVFGRFKVLFAHANPRTVSEAMKVARKIIKDMDGVSKRWVENLDDLYQEIIDTEGEGSHLMS